MIYLILAILSSSSVAVLMRLSGKHSRNGMTMLAANYLMCTAAACVTGWLSVGEGLLTPSQEGLLFTVLTGVVSGGLYLLGFVLLRWNMGRSGVVLPATFQKLGIALPTLAAITIFRETPRWTQLVGIVLAVTAILVMQERQAKQETAGRGSMPGLIALMITCGGCDLMAKVFEAWGNQAQKDHYLLLTFLTALALCVILCVVKRQGVTRADVLWGFAIGVPNYMSARFLLLSLTQVDAMVVYPTFSVGVIVLVTVVGVMCFSEKLGRRKLAALALILVALALMNMGGEKADETVDHGGQRIPQSQGSGAGASAGE